jgi:hypothetical protein
MALGTTSSNGTLNPFWASDFFTKNMWTLRGPVAYYILFSSIYTPAASILPA